MTAKQRERFEVTNDGEGLKYYLNGTLITTKQNLSKYDKIIDWVGEGDGYNLDVIHITAEGGIGNVQTSGNITGRRWVNWQMDRLSNPHDGLYAHLIHPDKPTNAQLAAKCLKMTNPSRPYVDIGIMIGELRDFPLLIQRGGDSLIQKFGKQTLNREFGWKPLASDLRKLMDFQKVVLERMKEIDRLESEGGLKRTVTLWKGSTISSYDVITQSGDKLTCHHYLDYCTQTEIKGFVVWKPSFPQIKQGERLAKIMDTILGLRFDISTLWNIIPWTWLIDWFSNVGDILEASRNQMEATHSSIQLMTHSKTTIQGPSSVTGISPFNGTLETKTRRTVAGVTLEAHLPFLSTGQISILGSIGVTRRLPR